MSLDPSATSGGCGKSTHSAKHRKTRVSSERLQEADLGKGKKQNVAQISEGATQWGGWRPLQEASRFLWSSFASFSSYQCFAAVPDFIFFKGQKDGLGFASNNGEGGKAVGRAQPIAKSRDIV